MMTIEKMFTMYFYRKVYEHIYEKRINNFRFIKKIPAFI